MNLKRARSADDLAAVSPLACGPAEVERWNREWLDYLGREWEIQLSPHTAYPGRPPLPALARELIDLQLGYGPPLELYCDREAIEGRSLLELGCGCGNLGKLLGRYSASYLGTDLSTLALKIARLVSPANCSYVHVADRAGLQPFFAGVDTVVGRYFWIHQNLEQARLNLDFIKLFLRPGGRVYADFYSPNPEREQGIVRSPREPLSRSYPSLTFHYRDEDLRALLSGQPFRILSEEIVLAMQRRYVVLERTPGDGIG